MTVGAINAASVRRGSAVPGLTIDLRKAFDSGIGTYIRQVVPRVLARLPGARVRAVVQRGDSARHRYLDAARVDWVEVDAPPFSLHEQWQLRKFVRMDGVFWATSLAHPLYARGPLVNTVHDVMQLALPASLGGSLRKRMLARPFFDSVRRSSSQVLFNSDSTAAEFRRLVGEPAAPAEAIPLGVDEAWFEAPGNEKLRPMPEPYFVMLGNLKPHKNLSLVLKALNRLSDTLPHKLLIIGPDPSPHATDSAMARLQSPVAQRLVFAGPLAMHQVRNALRQAEGLLFPSHCEGFGLPVLEAMACGCPVLVARNGISPSLAGEDALTFDPNDASELAQAMVAQTSMSTETRSRKVQAGIKQARSHSWDLTAQRTAAALDRVSRSLPGIHARALAA